MSDPNSADIHNPLVSGNLYSAKNNVYEKDCILLAKMKRENNTSGHIGSRLNELSLTMNDLHLHCLGLMVLRYYPAACKEE